MYIYYELIYQKILCQQNRIKGKGNHFKTLVTFRKAALRNYSSVNSL
jgi:hypothetical protein